MDPILVDIENFGVWDDPEIELVTEAAEGVNLPVVYGHVIAIDPFIRYFVEDAHHELFMWNRYETPTAVEEDVMLYVARTLETNRDPTIDEEEERNQMEHDGAAEASGGDAAVDDMNEEAVLDREIFNYGGRMLREFGGDAAVDDMNEEAVHDSEIFNYGGRMLREFGGDAAVDDMNEEAVHDSEIFNYGGRMLREFGGDAAVDDMNEEAVHDSEIFNYGGRMLREFGGDAAVDDMNEEAVHDREIFNYGGRMLRRQPYYVNGRKHIRVYLNVSITYDRN